MNDRSQKEEAKKKGFSRRHETNEAHLNASAAYLAEHGEEARQRKADERQAVREVRSPKEQLSILDERLGNGQGAQKERARLAALITS